jgi:hypothetical protein
MRVLLALTALALSSVSATPFADLHPPRPELSSRTVDVNGSYIPVTAPRENIFADFTSDEEDEILAWLARQANSTLYVPP